MIEVYLIKGDFNCNLILKLLSFLYLWVMSILGGRGSNNPKMQVNVCRRRSADRALTLILRRYHTNPSI